MATRANVSTRSFIKPMLPSSLFIAEPKQVERRGYHQNLWPNNR